MWVSPAPYSRALTARALMAVVLYFPAGLETELCQAFLPFLFSAPFHYGFCCSVPAASLYRPQNPSVHSTRRQLRLLTGESGVRRSRPAEPTSGGVGPVQMCLSMCPYAVFNFSLQHVVAVSIQVLHTFEKFTF